MAAAMILNDDEVEWETLLNNYENVLREKSKQPKKGELLQLDNWYQNQLPGCIASRSPKHLAKDELVKIMKWKLMRGKFRPRLTELVQQNTEKEVKEITEKSIQLAEDVQKAIKEMTKLKAVGPATASAILCASNPEIYPFMADEAMAGIPNLKIDYTIGNYLKFQKELKQKSSTLNQACKSNKWTPHKIELALWTEVTAKKLGMNLNDHEGIKKKRKIKEDSDGGEEKKSGKRSKRTK